MITAKQLRNLSAPERGNRLYFDGQVPGFAVRITAKGAASFVLNYYVHGRERRFTIGRYPMLTVAEARAEAIRLRGEILKGRDPLETRANDREAPTMTDLARDYFEFYANKTKRESSLRNDRSMLASVGRKVACSGCHPARYREPARFTSRDAISCESRARTALENV